MGTKTIVTRSEREAEVERLIALRESAVYELSGLPDVRWVGVGIRERGGELTGELVFRVYVDRKRLLSELPKSRIVPRSVVGVPTDVVETLLARPTCWDKGTRPVIGGIEVASSPFDEMQNMVGTIGCLVTARDGKQAILSNHHVLARALGDKRIFQPHYDTCLGFTCNRIGTVLPGFHNHHEHDDGLEYWLDCAIAELDSDVGSNNRVRRVTNVAVEGPIDVPLPSGTEGIVRVNAEGKIVAIHNEEGELVDTTSIAASAPALPGTIVWKVGNKTDLTAGIVVEVVGMGLAARDSVTPDFRNVLMVRPLAGAKVDREVVFSDFGDSGSVIVDLSNRVVGLLAGSCFRQLEGGGTEEAEVTYGCRIEPVISALGVTINPSPEPIEPAGGAAEVDEAEPVDLGERLSALEARLLTTASGARFLGLLHRHAVEVYELVSRCRAVTVVWHRHRGPAFAALLARALCDPNTPMPQEVDGVPLERMLVAMKEVLVRHGSPVLRASVEKDGDWLLDLVCSCMGVGDFLSRLDDASASTDART